MHGLWGGAWVWDAVRSRLDDVGVPSTAVDLPLQTLEGDVAAVTTALDEVAGPALLVGHSYGGAVITAAGTHPAVAGLVYLAAFQLAEGESIARACPGREVAPVEMDVAMRTMMHGDVVIPDPDTVRPLLYNRTPPDVAAAAVARLRPVSTALFRGRPSRIAWHERPSTYVVCADDHTVSPQLQRAMAERATHVLEWDCDHCPMDSRPIELAALLAELARG